MDQGFNESVYLIDLSHVKTAAEIVFDLSSILDSEEARNKRICLKLGGIDLNQAQLLSIKSLINSINSTLSYVDTLSKQTESAALALGIIIENAASENIQPPEPEMTYKTIDEVIQSIDENATVAAQEESAVQEESVIPEEYAAEYHEEETPMPSTPREYEKLEIGSSEEAKTTEVKESIIDEETAPEAISNEEIQEELDNIFSAEKKLEGIFDSAKANNLNEIQENLYSSILEDEKEYTEEDFELDSFPTKYIKQTIRSGQVINYEGNIVIIGDCHPGSEIVASGDITIWGVLGGIAHAGSVGNERARIRTLKMNAIQLRIADCYARRPDALNTIFVEKTNSFTPEEARIINGEIVIFKIND